MDKMRSFAWFIFVFVCLGSVGGVAENATNSEEELARLTRELQETRSEVAHSHQEIEELRRALEELRNQVQANPLSEKQMLDVAEPSTASADQDSSFLAAKVAELHQNKVESASKYRVKLSGLVLFNSYRNSGSLDL